ncbi:hypothetical protein [Cellulosimicrobium sp. Marseille-Q8652]
MRPARALAVLLPVALVGAACSSPVDCPGVGYGSVLEVRLFDGWPERDLYAVEVSCPPAVEDCSVGEDEEPEGPVWRGSVGEVDEIEVRVTEAGTGAVVQMRTAEPRFRVVEHPYGEQCGGPREAVVSLVDR